MQLRLDIITYLIMISVAIGAVILKGGSVESAALAYAISVTTDLVPFIRDSLAAFAEL